MIDNKTIKKFILNSTNDLDELIYYLDKDYKPTIEGIFNALFPLLKLYPQNQGRVDYLLGILEQIIELKPSNELTLMLGPITDLDNKINSLPLKTRMQLNYPYQRIKKIVDEIDKKSLTELESGKLKYLEYLIFQNQDLFLIDNFIERNQSLLTKKNKDGNDIVEEILKIYLYLNDKEIDKINYYYHVLLIILTNNNHHNFQKNKKKYYRLIKESKVAYKEHIIKIIELLVSNFQVDLSEIEEKYNINFNFHKAILKETENIQTDSNPRENYLYQNCLTIDGEDTNCLDDALYIEKNTNNTYTLYIHIIDIPSIIPYNSLINEEARKRIKTCYLRQNQILLYPEIISYNKASILEDQPRNVITYIFTLDENFNLISEKPTIKLGQINNRHRLTYGEVDNMYNSFSNDELTTQINWLAKFSEERRKTNPQKEKYRLYENIINRQINHESLKLDYSVSANIVHETMILVNYAAAKTFKELNYPYIYRKVIIPSSDYIERQIQTIKQLDSTIIEDKTFINKIKESAMESIYSDKPVQHTGLKLPCYSHSTSPARRYPDAFCQYITHDLIINQNTKNIHLWDYRTKELVKYLNTKEIEIERFTSEYNYLSYRKLIKKK